MCHEKTPVDKLAVAIQLFEKLPVIRVFIKHDAGMGNQANAYFCVQRYLELGYKGTFEIVYTKWASRDVATLFGISESSLVVNFATQSGHPQIRFIQHEALLKYPHMFEQVSMTIAGEAYLDFARTLKTDLFVAPSNMKLIIATGSGEVLVDDWKMANEYGRSIIFPLPTRDSIRNLLKSSDYGKTLADFLPGIPAIVRGVMQGKINAVMAYGMDWSFWLPSEEILAKITAATCQTKLERVHLQRPTLILVLNQFSWWHWRTIRKTLEAILTPEMVDDFSYMAGNLLPCSTDNRTIPVLTPGVELVTYLSSASPNSVALVKMPPLHPELFAYLVDKSPFPYLYEGRSSSALLVNVNKPGIHSFRVSYSETRLHEVVTRFREQYDKSSKVWDEFSRFRKMSCEPKNDLFLNTLVAASNLLKVTQLPQITDKQLSPSILNEKLSMLHYGGYVYAAILPASVFSISNTLHKRGTMTYPKATLLKYGALMADGYFNDRLAVNSFLIAADMLYEFGFEEEMSLLFVLPMLHNIVGWVLYYPASLPIAKQRVTEVASSVIGAAVGKVCGNVVTNVACNCASWFYRRIRGDALYADNAASSVVSNQKSKMV